MMAWTVKKGTFLFAWPGKTEFNRVVLMVQGAWMAEWHSPGGGAYMQCVKVEEVY